MSASNQAPAVPTNGAFTLASGDLRAVLLPATGMLVASFCHRGVELLRRVDNLEAAAEKGRTAGVPLLYPWANRLSGARYVAAGRAVVLDPSSSLLHFDDHGLAMHGVPWSRLGWQVVESTPVRLAARLDWGRPDLLAVFPFPHRLVLQVALHPDGLTFDLTLEAGAEGHVPVSFGFHPFVAIPGLARREWVLSLPPMRRVCLDARGIPTGGSEPFAGFDGALGELGLDDGFELTGGGMAMSIRGAGRRIVIELVEGFTHAQVFAPSEKELVALEPMTAPTDALTTGRGLRLVPPGRSFKAVFRLRVDAIQ